jgi:hypothetical protein
VVVEVDVRHDRNLRPQRRDRPVGLVALHDEPALACSSVAAQLRHVTADQKSGVIAEAFEAEGDHRRRRRLSMRAGNDDRAL